MWWWFPLQPLLTYSEGVSPLAIMEEEELERLAGLQLRDSLVRGLKVSEQFQASMKGGVHQAHSVDSVPLPLQATTSDLFTCRYHTHQERSPTECPAKPEQRMLGMTRTTPLHSLPGSLSTSSFLHSSKAQLNHWSNSKPNLHKRHQARSSILTTTIAQCNPSPGRPIR